ncbi:unnamed protein product [Arctia plantaginis]|uniref:Uncharacterized protein n=1 Tax=Arctia plantaginis TaxID=874455 RepID=A0A8S0YV00_ARCPL|nr:unnamed protein product [Arctia plantaginis]CAB3237928.1 unnamed protein product [Arctia plantaginis]
MPVAEDASKFKCQTASLLCNDAPSAINGEPDETQASVARLPLNHTVPRQPKKNSSKMKLFIVFALFVAAAVAAPAGPDADAQILRYESDNKIDGHTYAVETSNGIAQQEEGQLRNAGTENEIYAVRGQFSYTGPDGVVYLINYIADENGFQPQGSHIPA